jgi:hypothetical protein
MNYQSVILGEHRYGGLPVGYWPLDEANGIVAADVRGVNNGIFLPNNGTVWTGGSLNNRPGPLARENGWPLFNGSTHYVSLGTLGNLGANLGAGLTLEAWIKTTQTTLGTIFGWQLTTSDESILLIVNYTISGGETNGALTIDLRDHANKQVRFGVNSGAGVNDGKVHHIVATCTPLASGTPTGAICVDGAPLSVSYHRQDNQSNWVNINDSLAIACDYYAGGQYLLFSGNLGHAAVYNYVADQAFVDRHFLCGINGTFDRRRAA